MKSSHQLILDDLAAIFKKHRINALYHLEGSFYTATSQDLEGGGSSFEVTISAEGNVFLRHSDHPKHTVTKL